MDVQGYLDSHLSCDKSHRHAKNFHKFGLSCSVAARSLVCLNTSYCVTKELFRSFGQHSVHGDITSSEL